MTRQDKAKLYSKLKKLGVVFQKGEYNHSTMADMKKKRDKYLQEKHASHKITLAVKTHLKHKSEASLITFIQHPVEGKQLTTTGMNLLKNIKHINFNQKMYLLMHHTFVDNSKTTSDEYKVISNVEGLAKLLNKISRGVQLKEMTVQGSDTALLQYVIKHNAMIDLQWVPFTQDTKINSGAFFRYYHMTKLDLTRYQIFNEFEDSKQADKEACLIYALQQSRIISSDKIVKLKMDIFDKEIKAKDLREWAGKLEITIEFTKEKSKKIFNAGCKKVVCIGLVDNHYFINEPTNITMDALTHYDQVKNREEFPLISMSRNTPTGLTSFQVINKLVKDMTLLKPITLSNLRNKQTVDTLIDYTKLTEPEHHCKCKLENVVSCLKGKGNCCHYFCQIKTLLRKCTCKTQFHEFRDYSTLRTKHPFKMQPNAKVNPNDDFDIWFVDTETFIRRDKSYHCANCICAILYNEQFDTFQEVEFFGLDCVEQFLESCIKKHSIIYAHNQAFDFTTFIDFMHDLKEPIKTGTKLKQIQCKFKNYHMLFKDSYAFLADKLCNLPKMFDLVCGDKEVFPYDLINESTFDAKVSLTECRKHLKVGERKAFTLNAKRIGAFDIKNNTVDMKLYTLHYCRQDVRILAHAFIKFRKQIQQVCELDILNRISLPQLADDYLKSKGVYDDVFSFSGTAQDFIRRCCVGGRVMSRNNKKHHIKVFDKYGYTLINGRKILHHVAQYSASDIATIRDCINCGAISDFDAVSLYPSAMFSMKGYVRGLPKVLSRDQIKRFHPQTYDAYYVEIEVLSHTIDRAFPLQSIKNDNGIRDFTNDIDGKRFYVDNIALEDFVVFQDVKYKVIRGYYFDDGFNTKIKDTIEFMFNERARLKKVGNSLQNVYKLLMNASYGKLIQKPVKSSRKFVEAKDLQKYVSRNHKFIDKYDKVNDHLYIVKEHKSIVKHFTACHIASNILSMSKRLMNRVMCLAEDKNLDIYYQDTDSMHIFEQAIPKLAEAFKEKYGTELIGKDMCQFHSDFSVSDKNIDEKNPQVRSTELIILGKKCYIDKLRYKNKFHNMKTDYHIRMKGCPLQAIKDYDAIYMKTYEFLLTSDKGIEFPMVKYCPLQIDDDFRARVNTKCPSRKLCFN